MKKIVFVLLAVLAVFCLVSCDHGNASAPTPWYVGTWKSDNFTQIGMEVYGIVTLSDDGKIESLYYLSDTNQLCLGYRGTYTINSEETKLSTILTEEFMMAWKSCNLKQEYTIAKTDGSHITLTPPESFNTDPADIPFVKQ